jgi:hypothetical protein
MCYSAQIRTGYEKYVRAYGADISIREFVQLYWQRSEGGKITTGERVLGCPSDLRSHRKNVQFGGAIFQRVRQVGGAIFEATRQFGGVVPSRATVFRRRKLGKR